MSEKENTELTVAERRENVDLTNIFGNTQAFAHAQRIAKMLAASEFVPKEYRKVENCVIALNMANRIGADVLAVMQNTYVVHGKPSWASKFLISCVNASGKFSPLRYEITGQPNTDTWGCRAWAMDKTGEKLCGPEVTIEMAKKEGWYGKNGSKWQTMPELMLHYRAATFFARLYAPDLTMGMQTHEEAIEIEAKVIEPDEASPKTSSGKGVVGVGELFQDTETANQSTAGHAE